MDCLLVDECVYLWCDFDEVVVVCVDVDVCDGLLYCYDFRLVW